MEKIIRIVIALFVLIVLFIFLPNTIAHADSYDSGMATIDTFLQQSI